MSTGPEAKLERKANELAKRKYQALIVKGDGVGVADRFYLLPHKRIVIVEWKSPVGKLTENQKHWLKEAYRRNFEAYVLRDLDSFERILKEGRQPDLLYVPE
jgi:hypothetical protein